jgi:2-methylfumaryl-CoA hydratase
MTKSKRGYFFEDFFVGMIMRHATPKTVTEAMSRSIPR